MVAAAPHDSDEWLYEVKFDGYRMLVRVDGNSIRLISRNDNDWTPKLEPLRAELERMALPPGWYDGEIVVNDTEGRPDFGLLQNAFDRKRAESITMYLFDAPYLRRHDICEVPSSNVDGYSRPSSSCGAHEAIKLFRTPQLNDQTYPEGCVQYPYGSQYTSFLHWLAGSNGPQQRACSDG